MKVYFNNSCKICKAEIDLYKKEKCSEIDWVDITNNKVASEETNNCLLYTSPSPRDATLSRMPSSA